MRVCRKEKEMRIKDIYLKKGNWTVSAVIAALCVVATVISMLFPDAYQTLAYAYPVQHPWQICSGIFLHGSPELPMAADLGHLVFNLLLVIPFGIMIEKILGSKRFAMMTLALWVVNAITFFIIAMVITPAGETAYGAGISGIAFSYGVMGLYILLALGKKSWKRLFTQVGFYLLIQIVVAMIVMVNPYVAGVASMIMHLVAIVFGLVFTVIYRKKIGEFFCDAQAR